MMPSSTGAHEQDFLKICAEQEVEESTYFNVYDLATKLIVCDSAIIDVYRSRTDSFSIPVTNRLSSLVVVPYEV